MLVVGPAQAVGRVRPARRVRRRPSRLVVPFARLVAHSALIEQILWLLVGGLLVLSVWASPRMQPRRLVVHGAPSAAQPLIESRLRSLWQKQPYSMRLGARTLEKELKRLGWVAGVQVRPQLPAQLHLHLQPREAFVEVRTEYAQPMLRLRPTRVFIDPTGIVFQLPNPPAQARGGVILLSGSVALPPEGMLPEGSPLWRAFALLRALCDQDRSTRYARTVRIEPNGEMSLSCQAEGGLLMRFRLGDAALYQQQAQVIHLLLRNSPAQVARWEYVDLKSPFHPAVKPRATQGNLPRASDLPDSSNREKTH
ncbi:Cell division protein FtsQ [bacterium HR15]|nr:Cell division protein FtsQ [bacterium HR15]